MTTAAATSEPASSGPASPAGILVVAVDRLPAWIVPAYGATWVAMPRLTALAARGVVFDRAIAAADDPREALASLLGGAGEPPPLVAAAAAIGWRTTLVTDDATMAVAGADVVRVPAAPRATPTHDSSATCLARLGAAAGEAVAARPHGLVVVHASSLGVCWDAPVEFRDAYVDPDDPPPHAGADVPDEAVAAGADPDALVGIRQAYAGQLTLLDGCIGPVLEAAVAAGWHVLLAGLRGLALGLHGRVGPGPLPPYGELVHVPAILASGDARMAGQRFGGLVVQADLGATLVDHCHGVVDGRQPWQGRSLAGLFATWRADPRDRVIATAAVGTAVVTPGWHLVAAAGSAARLFAKPDDYFELCDVADRCRGVAEELGGLAATAGAGDLVTAWTTPLSAEALVGPHAGPDPAAAADADLNR